MTWHGLVPRQCQLTRVRQHSRPINLFLRQDGQNTLHGQHFVSVSRHTYLTLAVCGSPSCCIVSPAPPAQEPK
jgi:hypothetical protein